MPVLLSGDWSPGLQTLHPPFLRAIAIYQCLFAGFHRFFKPFNLLVDQRSNHIFNIVFEIGIFLIDFWLNSSPKIVSHSKSIIALITLWGAGAMHGESGHDWKVAREIAKAGTCGESTQDSIEKRCRERVLSSIFRVAGTTKSL